MYFSIIKYVTGIYLFMIGIFIGMNSKLKRHPYSLITLACLTESAYIIHYVAPTIIFDLVVHEKYEQILYYMLDPYSLYLPYNKISQHHIYDRLI